jgi:hypothetical protein
MVPFGVKEAGHLQNATGAVGYAQLAAFTALDNQVDLTTRHNDAI